MRPSVVSSHLWEPLSLRGRRGFGLARRAESGIRVCAAGVARLSRRAASVEVTREARAALTVTLCVLAIAMPVRAQSLADIAREEEARRQQIKHPAKVYTNKDLVSVPPPARPAAAPAAPDAGDVDAGKPRAPGKDEKGDTDGAAADTTGVAPTVRPRDQAYWSARMSTLVTQLDRDRILADALQSRINALTADFSARDDPAQRALIGLNRQKTLDELDRLRKSVLTDQKAIADLQEEARRASVPPGWLR
jgi:hypothetical protein